MTGPNRPAQSSFLSIVSPCHNEEDNIQQLCARSVDAAQELYGENFELILVNDGSTDGTWRKITEESARRPQVRGVNLSRNYGHQLALTAGLSKARGDRILMLDADLQDPPELLPALSAALDGGADVAYGKRRHRAGETFFKKASAKLFYRFINTLSDTDIPRDTGDFRLVSRRALTDFLNMPERQRFVRGMIAWIGYEQVAVEYDRDARRAGDTKYTLGKMIRFATDAITSFSTAPIRVAAFLSILAFCVAALSCAYVVYSLAAYQTSPGWASVLIAVSVFSGAQLLSTAIIGEYVGRLFTEIKNRPLYIISDETNAPETKRETDWDDIRDHVLQQPQMKSATS